MSEPPNKPARRRRRPTLRSALEAAQKTGTSVKSATYDADGKLTLTFGEPTADTSNEWDRKLEELERGKH
jgi:hypothetical protein